MTTESFETNRIKLTGRIYPAIQSCVGNRYKIIVGYFTILGFVLFDETRVGVFVHSGAAFFTAFIFTAFVVHNAINYRENAKEQFECEGVKDSPASAMELWSSGVMVALIWGGLCLLVSYSCSA